MKQMKQDRPGPFATIVGKGGCVVQVTLQLRPRDADVIKRIALAERRTPRLVAQQLLRGAIAGQTIEPKNTEVPVT
jgi:hypothetical protein